MRKTIKLIALAMAFAMTFALTACGGEDKKTTGDNGSVASNGGTVSTNDDKASEPTENASTDAPTAGDVNANIAYEYFFNPLDGEKDRFVTVIATNNNTVNIEGYFEVHYGTKDRPINLDAITSASSSKKTIAPGGKLVYSSKRTTSQVLDFEFTEVQAKGVFEQLGEEDAKSYPPSAVKDLSLDYKIEGGVLKGTVTNNSKEYNTQYNIGLVLYKGEQYVGGSEIWDYTPNIDRLSVDPGESMEVAIDLNYVGEFDKVEYYFVGYGSLPLE